MLRQLLYAALFEASGNVGTLLIQLIILELVLADLHETDLRGLILHAHFLKQALLCVNFFKICVSVVFAVVLHCFTADVRQIAGCRLGRHRGIIMRA